MIYNLYVLIDYSSSSTSCAIHKQQLVKDAIMTRVVVLMSIISLKMTIQ